MEWHEEAVVLGIRRHGETSVIAEVMTRARGRHLGLVRGGRSRKLQSVLQPGNTVSATWRARIDEHMGTFVLEPVVSRAGRLMESALGLNAVQLIAAHLRLLPERDAHIRLYAGLLVMLDNLDEGLTAGALMLKFEIAVLEELGFGLDLSQCAATGETDDLIYVSPKSGRAVSRAAGAPWADKLLKLPAFLAQEGEGPDVEALTDGFMMTRYFLARHVYEPRGIAEPMARSGFIAAITRNAPQEP